MMNRSILLGFVALPFVAVGQFRSDVKPVPADLKKGFDAITVADGKKFLGYLAGPICEGRGTGEPGYDKAAQYMADNFKRIGLKPGMPDGSYFQYNDFWRSRVNPKSLHVSISGNDLAQSDISMTSVGNVDMRGTGVLVVVPKADSTVTDILPMLKGKIIFLYNPAGNRAAERALGRSEAQAVVLLSKEVSEPSWIGRARQPAAEAATFGRFSVTESAFWSLVGDETKKQTMDYVSGQSVAKMWALSSNVALKGSQEIEKVKVANVVAILEGSDPTLKNEYIGVGAHLDHLGRRGKTIYYGADDDGSGNAALLQLATGLIRNPIKPKRSVFFMAFYGEEMGLLGSRFLSDNCPFPIENMFAELQMDMVGRDSDGAQNGDPKRIDKASENTDTIRLVGSKRISTKLDDIIQETNNHVGFRFKYDAEDVYTRSDHFNFARKGIPIAFFFSGFHSDYHQATDTIDKINFDKITNTAKLNYLIIHRLGDFVGRLPKN
jgi:hypothetical protein